MGIKYFFSWFKKTFSKNIRTIQNNLDVKVDTFLIDLNGIFHYCAQKAFNYGAFAKERSNLNYNRQLSYFLKETGNYINDLVAMVQPKRIVLCIDGVAPVSKQFQQRQRRYKSTENEFDSNCITPGTSFMNSLSQYLEWFIRFKMTTDPLWTEVIFSNEKVPGEGEHKLVKYVRNFGSENDHYMIYGMDADLIMLALASQRKNFHILRENPYKYNEFFHIDMNPIRETLVYTLLHEPSMSNDQFFINDFILMMFMSGNDFLPHLPTIDILEGSIETFFDVYRSTVSSYGNIVTPYYTIQYKPLSILFGTLASTEKSVLEERRKKVRDSLLEKHTKLIDKEIETYQLNWEEYRKDYYAKFNCHSESDIEKVCKQYLQGMQWVLTYYLEGVSSWNWYYPHSYAPFCSDLQKYCLANTDKVVSGDKPYDPLFQLLCVLPPKSAALLPESLQSIMTNKKTAMFYPKEIKIDMDGKRNEWEGIVILPPIDHAVLYKEYKKIAKNEVRNKVDSARIYKTSSEFFEYKSYYGNIKCNISIQNIDL